MRPESPVIVIGGSAGAIATLERIAADIGPDLHAPVLVVVHIPARARSMLPAILERHGKIPASHVTTEMRLEDGRIYVAPPDRHIVVDGDIVRPIGGARVNRNRPSIDPLFISAARQYGSRVIGVLLSGYLDDGVAGLRAIRESGGTVIVQDPASTLHTDMPISALARVDVNYTLKPEEIGTMIIALSSRPLSSRAEATMSAEFVSGLTQDDGDPVPQPDSELLAMSCPDCNGVLQAVDPPHADQFRCRVGHVFSLESLLAAKTDEVETALWTAIRALEKKAQMTQTLSTRLRARGASRSGERYVTMAETLQRDADLIRTLVTDNPAATPVDE